MNTPVTLVAVVSKQAAANLLPIFDATLLPARAVLCASPEMQAEARRLAAVFKKHTVTTTIRNLPDAHHFGPLQEFFLQLAAELDGQTVQLNLSGGNKLMALAAYDVAASSDWQAYYLDIDTNAVTWLGSPPHDQALDAKANLVDYIATYGYTVERDRGQFGQTQAQKAFSAQLIAEVEHWPKALGKLNRLAQEADERGTLHVSLTDPDRADANLMELLDAGERYKLWSLTAGRLQFGDSATRYFANGGWLEQHVYQIMGELSQQLGVRDAQVNLTLRSETDVKVQNELDVAFLAHNRLYAIECKTKRMNKGAGANAKATDALHKLKEIADRVGGIGSHCMLVTYRVLGESEEKRARELGVETVAGPQLRGLTDHLFRWVRG